jgi:hypothetical protein
MIKYTIEVRQISHFDRLLWGSYTSFNEAKYDFDGLCNNPNMIAVYWFQGDRQYKEWERSPLRPIIELG